MQGNKSYDYIIAGMGCAGLSLAMQLKKSKVEFSKILIVDKELKNKNDRTWCFWTKEIDNWFDNLVFKKWNQFTFKSMEFENNLFLDPYNYLMIRGIDFYSYCLKELKEDTRFEIVIDEIVDIGSEGENAFLKTSTCFYKSSLLFNSAFRNLDLKKGDINYVQHFKGWVIESEKAVFDLVCPVFMDFNVDQHNDCRFVYIIPYSKTKALIEYTGFSKNALSSEAYDMEISNYIKKNLKLDSYTILETEQGEIPMAESKFMNPYGKRVINIGTAGGSSKPSTGYTFYFIQKNNQTIVSNLENKLPNISMPLRQARYAVYDKILLAVLNENKISAAEIFSTLFQKNKTKNLLAFLNEESSVVEDLGILNSVQRKHFIRVAIKKLLGS